MFRTEAPAAEITRRNETGSYRPDLDGLRAIAVTAVVLYHAGMPGFRGGFVGVDIFFVISGFLIGGIVFRQVTAGSFTFAGFYTRRARRILPALISVTAAACAAGYLLLPPREYAHASVSAASALAGLSNIRFWLAQGYFTQDPALDPFLMTWSLGIEEQFYLLLPPFLLLMRRLPRERQLVVLWLLTAVSLLLCVVVTALSRDAAFYLIPTRAWELAIGVILAVRQNGRIDISGSRPANALSIFGALGMAAAIVAFSPATAFPGYAAVLPVAATAALILAEGTWFNRIVLSSAPFVRIGLISYSWYLWHWPIFSFLRIVSARTPTGLMFAAAVVVSLAAGYLSWRFIETPFRRPRPQVRELPRYGAALVVSLALALLIKLTGGFPSRVPASVLETERALAASQSDPCLAQDGQQAVDLPPACLSSPGARAKVVLVGDSHAAALAPGLRKWASANGLGFEQLTKTSCPPLLGLTRLYPPSPGGDAECAGFNASAIERIVRDPAASIIVMSAFWSAPDEYAGRGEAYEVVGPNGSLAPTSGSALAEAVARTVKRYREPGKRVIVFGDTPSFAFDPARHAVAYALPLRRRALQVLAPDLDFASGFAGSPYVAPRVGNAEQLVARGSLDGGATYQPLAPLLCAGTRCRFALPSGMPLYSDTHHLSPAGADYLVSRLDPRLHPR
jgi:peptidoglycan/LPS O-acetylase OafA/YrhL